MRVKGVGDMLKHEKICLFVLVPILFLVTFCHVSLVKAPAPDVELGAFTSTPPDIDGIMSPGEWDDAATIDFDLLGPGTPRPVVAHTLYVMNDVDNLYLAVRRYDETPGEFGDWVTFTFDNDDDGLIEDGDDRIKLTIVSGSPLPGRFEDWYYIGAIPSSEPEEDIDGSGAAGIDGTYTIFEISHPLDSGDYDHDFSLSFGDTVGFNIDSYDHSFDLGSWPADWPSVWDFGVAANFGDIVIVPPPSIVTIESCDSTGAKKDTFQLGDEVYVTGTGYSDSATYDVYLVEDVTWVDGMAIPPRVAGTAISISSDGTGTVPATLLWSDPLVPGKYDIVVDVDGDGLYYAESDALDDNDIQVTAGFFVIPEFWLGTILALAGCFAALGVFRVIKRKHQ
jgi:hypothetical protein